MKFYDKQGNTHKSMLGAMGANIANKFRGTKVGCKFDGVARRAEEQLDQLTDKAEKFSIPWARLKEIAVDLKDRLIEDGEEEAYTYMAKIMELSDGEAECLGLDMEMFKKAKNG